MRAMICQPCSSDLEHFSLYQYRKAGSGLAGRPTREQLQHTARSKETSSVQPSAIHETFTSNVPHIDKPYSSVPRRRSKRHRTQEGAPLGGQMRREKFEFRHRNTASPASLRDGDVDTEVKRRESNIICMKKLLTAPFFNSFTSISHRLEAKRIKRIIQKPHSR